MGVRFDLDTYAGRPMRVRPTSPGRHLWWDRLRGALSLVVARRCTARGDQGSLAVLPLQDWQRAGEGRASAHVPLPIFFRRRDLDWSPLRAALQAFAHQSQ